MILNLLGLLSGKQLPLGGCSSQSIKGNLKMDKEKTQKIKIKDAPTKDIVVKSGKYKGLIIKPYLSAQEINIANTNCIEQFLVESNEKGTTRYEIFPNVKIMYDLVVVASCTNLEVETTFEVYDNLVSSGLLGFVTSKIANYESTWQIILESIELRNTYMGLNLIENRIPNTKEFDKSVEGISKLISDLNKKDPETLRKIVETASIQNVREEVKKEVKQAKPTAQK